MKIIAKDANGSNDSPSFIVHSDGSYFLSDFQFTELDEVINQQCSDIEMIEDSYMEFVERHGLKKDEDPSVFEFLDSHHNELAGFFATKSEFESAKDYTTPALFIDSVKNNEQQFKILRRIYLGSLISSYLQLPTIEASGNVRELVLDTNFIVSLLDLTSVEACHTCRKILEISHKLGCKITVLDITLDETKALLERRSEL